MLNSPRKAVTLTHRGFPLRFCPAREGRTVQEVHMKLASLGSRSPRKANNLGQMACWGRVLVQWSGWTLGLPPPLGSPLSSAGPVWPSLAPLPLHRLLLVIEGNSVKRCHGESGTSCETPRGKTGILQRRAWRWMPRSCQSPREVELSS